MSNLGFYESLIVEYAEGRLETMNTEPKFKVGDRVQIKASGTEVVVERFYVRYIYSLRDTSGTSYSRDEGELAYTKLSEEEAWLEVALLVGREVQYFTDEPYRVLNESVLKEIRHQAYQILGGNGLDCNAHHEEYKARINQLIERAKARG